MKLKAIFLTLLALPLAGGNFALARFAYSPFSAYYTIGTLPFNTESAEFAPIIHENGLFFCKNNRSSIIWANPELIKGNIDLYFVAPNGTSPTKLKGEINTPNHEGAATFSASGKKMFFTQARKSNKDQWFWNINNADLLFGQWENVSPFYHNYRQNNIAHPTLSADGSSLYFAADLPGGYGGMDLYVCQRIGSFWSRPANLGAEVNGKYDDIYPFIHADGTLYFSSERPGGYGGFDFYETKQEGNLWKTALNMGQPFNSAQDDMGISFNKNKDTGYISSNRKGGQGGFDIYYLSASEKGAGDMFVSKNSLKLDVKTNFTGAIPTPEPTANTPMPTTLDWSKFNRTTALLNDVIGLKNIAYTTGDWHISPETSLELNKIAALLQTNPTLLIEIDVHTDARGDDNANLRLSQKRANEIKQYLITQNVQVERVTARGMGERYLKNQCFNGISCPETMHAANNRVEVLLVGGQPGTAQVAYSVNKAPATGNNPSTMQYEVRVGPIKNLDSRTYYDYKQINDNVSLEETPKGKVLVLGPYNNAIEANMERVKAQEKTGEKAGVSVSASSKVATYGGLAAPTKNAAPVDYELYVGPFKHVDTDTYHRFTTLKCKTGIRYTPKGTMIVLGGLSDLENVRQLQKKVVELTKKQKKIKTQIYTDNGKTLIDAKKK